MEVGSCAFQLSQTWPGLPRVRKEEADTRLILNATDAVQKGYEKVTA